MSHRTSLGDLNHKVDVQRNIASAATTEPFANKVAALNKDPPAAATGSPPHLEPQWVGAG